MITYAPSMSGLESGFTSSKLRQVMRQYEEAGVDIVSLDSHLAESRAVKELVEIAYNAIPVYRDKYRASGFSPDDLRSEGDVEKISPREENLKIPHMGWNTLDLLREHPVLERLELGPKGRHAYFVHSYHLNAVNEGDVLARADYGGAVTAIVARDTAVGTQFHPEKSQRFGLALISNFLKWKP